MRAVPRAESGTKWKGWKCFHTLCKHLQKVEWWCKHLHHVENFPPSYADQRIGEILRNIEQAKRGPKVNSPEGEKTKTETIKESGMSTKTAYDLQAMAANPAVVEAVHRIDQCRTRDGIR